MDTIVKRSFPSSNESADILAKYESNIRDSISILHSSRNGMDSNVFFDLAILSSLNKERLADDLLGISLKTILRYARQGKFLLPSYTERVLKLMALYRKGIEVFGEKTYFNNWLRKPAFGIGGQIPYDFLALTTGIDLVMDELRRIEFGDLS